MKLSELAFILTDDCNWRCSYCFQKRGRRRLEPGLAAEACTFFLPFLRPRSVVTFYGGEPLLAFDRIVQVVGLLGRRSEARDKRIRFALTTNGSLLSEEVRAFLDENAFEVLLSYDGLAHDDGRKKNSRKKTRAVLEKLLLSSNIKVGTNSVFTTRTVGFLSSSMKELAEMGVPDILMSLSVLSPWDRASLRTFGEELGKIRRWLAKFYGRTGRVPLEFFRRPDEGGTFVCRAGRDRMAVGPDGRLWGCYRIADYYAGRADPTETESHCIGLLNAFSGNLRSRGARILKNGDGWRMDVASTSRTPCPLCPVFFQCRICPITAAFAGGSLGAIPEHLCRSMRILLEARERFWDSIP